MNNFNGKVCLVTGASSGIGSSIAMLFSQNGATVVMTGRNANNLQQVANKIETSTGKKPLTIIGDLIDEKLPEKLINETIEKFGQLDILINNAGSGTPNGSYSSPNLIDEFDNLFKLNVRSVLALSQLAVPYLEKTKGNIINISSISSIKPIWLVYCASKASLDSITKSMAIELAVKGIRVNSIKYVFSIFTCLFNI